MSRALELIDLTKSYAGRDVLDGISCVVPAGGVTAVVGPSGSGKSTLLQIVGGWLREDGGVVAIDGVRACRSQRQQASTWIPQSSNSLSRRSVVDNVALGALAGGRRRRDAVVEARGLLDTFGLRALAHQPCRTISGGELQRVAIARARALGRPLLLADEPTGQLDAVGTTRIFEALRRAAHTGLTVLVATHDQRVGDVADQVIRLS